jgi:5-methylthioribose kinase
MLPEHHTFLHGDCHPGNVIVRDGELVLIDLADGGMGHPIIDLLSMCLSYKYMTMYGPEFYEEQSQIIGVIRPFSYDEARLIWSTFLHVYFGTDNEQFLSKAEGQILAFGALKLLLGTLDAPDYLAEDTLQSLKRIVLDFAASLEPVCF